MRSNNTPAHRDEAQYETVLMRRFHLTPGQSEYVFVKRRLPVTDNEPLLPFKGGLYHLAKRRPDIELVPVWIENLNRVMPKGEFVPVPLLCTVTFGAPLTLREAEDKAAFLERTRSALLALAPERETPR